MNTKRSIALSLMLLTLIGAMWMSPTVAETAAGSTVPVPAHAPAPPPTASQATTPASRAAAGAHDAQPAPRPVPAPPGAPASSGTEGSVTRVPLGAAPAVLFIALTAGCLLRIVLRTDRHATAGAVTYRPTVAKGVS